MGSEQCLEIKTMAECTLDEITTQWNIGFQYYFHDMTKTASQMLSHLNHNAIHPDLSILAYIDDVPAGFVLVGQKKVAGISQAWNGGTGVNPQFRQQGLARTLLREAVKRVYEGGADRFSLEVRTDNERAIAAYESVGFNIQHGMQVLRRNGAFHAIPFPRGVHTDYYHVIGTAKQVAALPFYLEQSAWSFQWYNYPESESVLVYDPIGQVVGYALFIKSYADDGMLSGIMLTHCEAHPDSEHRRDLIRYMLQLVFSPFDQALVRTGQYLRTTNADLIEAMHEAGFELDYEEYLMILMRETMINEPIGAR